MAPTGLSRQRKARPTRIGDALRRRLRGTRSTGAAVSRCCDPVMPTHPLAYLWGNRAARLGSFKFCGDVVHEFITSVTVGRIGFQQVLNHFLICHCAVLRAGLSHDIRLWKTACNRPFENWCVKDGAAVVADQPMRKADQDPKIGATGRGVSWLAASVHG